MKKILPIILLLISPFTVFAVGTFQDLMTTFQGVISPLVPLIVSLGVLIFFWGLIKYIRSADDPKTREEGRQLIIYGVIAIFVMISMWGLVNVIVDTVFGGSDTLLQDSDVPQGPF